jgi:DnaJ-class molecular chaperone
MATVKINCPKCQGLGLTGTVQEVVCSQCAGTGTISVNSTDTIATVNTNNIAQSSFIVTASMPTAVPQAALKISNRGK